MNRIECVENQKIIVQGEIGDFFYVVYEGGLKCYINNELVTSYTSGHCFGEIALLSNIPRSATVICSEPSVLFTLDRETFRNTLMRTSTEDYEDSLALLRKVSILKQLSNEQIENIANIVEVVPFHENDQIIKKGEKGDIFYMIKEGVVLCTNAGSSNGEIELKAGDHFGERALLLDEPRAANVIAKTNVICFAIVREAFSSIIGPLKNLLETSLASYVIKSMPYLKEVSMEIKQTLVNSIEKKDVKKDEILEEEGELVNNFIVVKEGKLDLYNRESETVFLNAGSYVNELVFQTTNTKNLYTIKADCDSTVLLVSRKTIHEILEIGLSNQCTEQKEQVEQEQKENSSVEDFKIIKNIGRGAFSRVYYVMNKKIGHFYAMKKINKTRVIEYNQLNAIINEKKFLFSCFHPFIQKAYSKFQDNNSVYFILEFYNGGDLFNRLLQVNEACDSKTSKFYISSILLGLAYLHDRNIVFRDLKPENVMIKDNGFPVIIDFGFAKVITTRSFTLCGTAEYLAPEIIIGKGHNKAVDYWSLGVLLYEMICCQTPFCAIDGDQQAIFRKILRGKYEFPGELTDYNCRNLISRLLYPDPAKRIGCLANGYSDIKRHPWFCDIDWKAVENQTAEAAWLPNNSNDPLKYFEEEENDREDTIYKGDDEKFKDF